MFTASILVAAERRSFAIPFSVAKFDGSMSRQSVQWREAGVSHGVVSQAEEPLFVGHARPEDARDTSRCHDSSRNTSTRQPRKHGGGPAWP